MLAISVDNPELPNGMKAQIAALSGGDTQMTKDKKQQRLAELKRREEEALLAAELARKKKKEEELRIAELKRQEEERAKESEKLAFKRKEEEARQLAELKRQEEEAKKAADVARRQKQEEEESQLATQESSKGDAQLAAAEEEMQRKLFVLKRLKDRSLISDKEFSAKKSELLNQFLGLTQVVTAKGVVENEVRDKLAQYADINFGNYHALVIGIDDYKHLPNLTTATNDARAIAEVLRDTYDFQVTILENPSRSEILDAFDELREKLGFEDNLLIYYAGHGWLDEEADRGYWLPTNAKPNRRSRWVSNADIIDTLRTLQSKHVMVIADSCFSGTLVRGSDVGIKGGDYWRRMAEKQARVAITSGGLEPVADITAGGNGKHSPFAKAFINVLNDNDTILDSTALFNKIRRPVMVATKQTPRHSDVRNAGHDGGDFLFVRRN